MTRWQKGILIGVAVLLVAALVVVTALYIVEGKEYKNYSENNYRKDYYGAVDAVSDINLKLRKVAVAGNAKTQNALLCDIWLDCEMAADKIGDLTAKDVSPEKIIKFYNQLGDYCKYLAGKNTDGLTFAEQEKLASLYKVAGAVKDAFDTASVEIFGGEKLAGDLSDGILLLGDGYCNFNNDSSVEYPEMIYDGPFSEGIAERTPKLLEGLVEASPEACITIIQNKFPGAENITLICENNGSIPSYLYGFTADGRERVATITRAGGLVASLTSNEEATDTLVEVASLVALAPSVAADFGYGELSVVWYTNQDSIVYVNLAYKQDGVIFYPDLVKLKFSGETGKLLSMDATGYIYNHCERVTPEEWYTLEEARAKVSTLLKVCTARLVVIPTEWNTEDVAYEFIGTYSGSTYYVYISATTLQELKVMEVVEENGGMLME